MDFPVWQLGAYGGGLLIAVIATVHVFVSHFAVGGGLYLVTTEAYARSRGLPLALAHVKKHARFFMLLTLVFGGLTGVAIWFTIALLSPGATWTLIRTFVFLFAAEWVAFIVEIAAILVYYYRFDEMEPRTHQIVGWVYFGAAWLSLFLITGIIGFMLDPGQWPASGSIWDAFFNPTLWPAVFLRTSMALLLAGAFGFVTAIRIKDQDTRERLVRLTAVWTAAPFFAVLACGTWYLGSLPEPARALVLGRNPEIARYLDIFLKAGPLAAAAAVVMAVRLPGRARAALSVAVLALGYAYIGSFEYVREAARRPWLIWGHTYSSGLQAGQLAETRSAGVLRAGGWTMAKSVGESDPPGARAAAGREVFGLACLPCHSLDGPIKDIRRLTAKYPSFGAMAMLTGLGRISPYMPPFPGNQAEKGALAAYLGEGLHGAPAIEPAFEPKPLPLDAPATDQGSDYALVAWSAQGMSFFSDADAAFSLLPPGTTLRAMLIRRGDPPSLVTQEVTLAYRLAAPAQAPAARLDYWRFAKDAQGRPLASGLGVAGSGVSGTMTAGADRIFEAALVPATPYPAQGGIDPYPLVTVDAVDAASGAVLASTALVLPASAEMGCKNCHGGPWREAGAMGMDKATAADILTVHDRRNGTGLAKRAAAGNPAACAECHADPSWGARGDGKRLSLSAAIHGLHAAALDGHPGANGDKACTVCHPADPKGATRAYRGLHSGLGLGCADCHGAITDHASALLAAEAAAGKPEAARLLAGLTPRAVPAAEVKPRAPWTNLPDCLTCHAGFGFGGSGASSGFNVWTKDASGLFAKRRDEMEAVACAACHGAPHAEYPAVNPYGGDRDNLQPLRYQKLAAPLGAKGGCRACHTAPLDISAHHPPPS